MKKNITRGYILWLMLLAAMLPLVAAFLLFYAIGRQAEKTINIFIKLKQKIVRL